MIDINSTEFYVLAFALAMALVMLLFGQESTKQATTEVTAMTLNPSVTADAGLVMLQSQDDGSVLVLRNAIPIDDGDTVNIVVTAVGDKLTIVEKKGVQSRSAIDATVDGTAMITHLPADRFFVCYESEITGQWALFRFTHRDNRVASSHLKL